MKSQLCLLLIFIFCSCTDRTQKNKPLNIFILKGSIIGKNTHTIFLSYKDTAGKKIEDSARVNNGTFEFNGSIISPVFAELTTDAKKKSENDSHYTEFFLSPGNMTVSIKEDDFDQAKITGSVMQDDWNKLKKLEEPTTRTKDSLEIQMNKLRELVNTKKVHAAYEVLLSKFDQTDQQQKQVNYKFITTHTQSFLSAYLLENFLGGDMPTDSIEMFYNPFSDAVKKSVSGKAIEKEIVNRKASSVGSIVRMPLGVNVDGSRFDPRSFKIDNYLLIYFWADWAIDNTRLKPIYNKYHSQGLDVLAISMDSFTKMWLDSVKQENTLMWHNILADPVGNLDTFYNIREMAPSLLLLVNKNHKIIGRYRGRSSLYKRDYDEGDITDLDKKLAKVLGDPNKH